MRSVSFFPLARSSSHSWTLANYGSVHITVTQDVIWSCTCGVSIPPSLPCRALQTAPTSRHASRYPHSPLVTPAASGKWQVQASFASLEGRKDTEFRCKDVMSLKVRYMSPGDITLSLGKSQSLLKIWPCLCTV